MPITNINYEEKLYVIGFSKEKLTSAQEKEAYDTYCCAISMSIMNDPVFDPLTPLYRFEKSEILKWLRIKPTHPITRASLTPDNLASDVELKQKIDAFVAEKILAHQQSIHQEIETPPVLATTIRQSTSVQKLMQDYGLTAEEIQNISEMKLTILSGRPKALEDLVNNAHIPLADLLNLQETDLLTLLISHTAVYILKTQANIPLDAMIVLPPDQSRVLLTVSGASVASVLINSLHMTLENILALDFIFRDKLLYSMRMARAFVFLIKEMEIQMEDILKLDSTIIIKLLNKPVILPVLLKETSFDKLLDLSSEQWSVLLTNKNSSAYEEILTLLRDDGHQNTR